MKQCKVFFNMVEIEIFNWVIIGNENYIPQPQSENF